MRKISAKYKRGDAVLFTDEDENIFMYIESVTKEPDGFYYSGESFHPYPLIFYVREDHIKRCLSEKEINDLCNNDNELLAKKIVKKSDCVREDEPYFYDYLLDLAKTKDEQAITEQGGWHTEIPTKDCYVLLMTPEFPKNCFYVVAEWDNDAKCFYSEETDNPILNWDYWKLIEEDNKKDYRKEIEFRKRKENNLEKETTSFVSESDFQNIRYRFYRSEHIKEIICEIDKKMYNEEEPEYANAVRVFNLYSSEKDFIEKLNEALKKYSD